MTGPSINRLLFGRLAELSPRDTFELGMYRLVAWSQTPTKTGFESDRYLDWAEVLEGIASGLRQAAK